MSPARVRRRRLLGTGLAFAVSPVPVLAQFDGQAAPFITTPDEVVRRMLQLAQVGVDDRVYDLGSGDGRIVLAAARDFGAMATGIELDQALVQQSAEAGRAAGLADRVSFRRGDVLREDISQATVVTMYLLPWLLEKLQPRLLTHLRPGTRVVSHAFVMPGWVPDEIETVTLSRSHPGQGDSSRIFLWIVPADLRGQWRAEDAGWQLDIAQNFQSLDISAVSGGNRLTVEGAHLRGTRIEFKAGRWTFRGALSGGGIAGNISDAGTELPVVFKRL